MSEPANLHAFYGFVTGIIHERRPELSVEFFLGQDRDVVWTVVRHTAKKHKARMPQSRRTIMRSGPGEVRGLAHSTAAELLRVLSIGAEAAAAIASPAAQARGPHPHGGGRAPNR